MFPTLDQWSSKRGQEWERGEEENDTCNLAMVQILPTLDSSPPNFRLGLCLTFPQESTPLDLPNMLSAPASMLLQPILCLLQSPAKTFATIWMMPISPWDVVELQTFLIFRRNYPTQNHTSQANGHLGWGILKASSKKGDSTHVWPDTDM